MRNYALCRIVSLPVIIGCVALFCGCCDNSPLSTENATRKSMQLSVVKQLSLEYSAALPVALDDGFIVADRAGGVTCFDSAYSPVWHFTHSDMGFASSGTLEGGCLYLGSDEGGVLCMDVADGSTLWSNRLDATFMHPPLHGAVKDLDALWLLSADSGVVYALNAETGELLWQGMETMRSDGGMVLWKQRLIYGNCDGAAHIFDALDGSRVASVCVGESDQMAGTPVVTDAGMLFIGTRQGNLAVVDVDQARLSASLKISEQEAFAMPVLCAGNRVAFGIQEGDILLLALRDGTPVIQKRYAAGAAVDHLLYDGELLYALANGDLMVFDKDLKLESALNVGDNPGGLVALESGVVAVLADNSLLFVKGELK